MSLLFAYYPKQTKNSSIEEIGVLEDGTCIGAVLVDEPSEQILIYPDGSSTRGSGEITFEIIYSGRSLPVQQSNYLVYEASRDDYVNKKLHSNDQFYSKVILSADENQIIPNKHSLRQNYPNPFNPITNIAYSIPETEKVNLSIFNIKGQIVKTLVNETKQSGYYSVRWNGTNNSGIKVASGLYFYKLSAGKTILNKKMILLK
ncbi:MAG: hypothetical protein DRI23_09985 [Candidatus Cloacimonadota bacterium]|nr:MAG: hypothetical protein DRI23_09985 [Candidatus Cloacimonadota bacterium]